MKDNSQGILIFAFNNDRIDYFKHACWVADRVEQYLGLPTTIVTNEKSINDRQVKHNLVKSVPESGGRRNFDHKTNSKVDDWFNAARYTAYNLSPYNETIVIDSDYIVNSDQLLKVFDLGHDVVCHRNAYDVSGLDRFRHYKYFGTYNFPHYWATVLYFKKSKFAENFFDVLTMVRKNYPHYANIHKFNHFMFRNDYAVSIALSIIYGHDLDAIPSIPWSIPTCYDDVNISNLTDNKIELSYDERVDNERNILKYHRTYLTDTDLHCINKFTLEETING